MSKISGKTSMKLPFKKGDIVKFVGNANIDVIDYRPAYKVMDCYAVTGYASGYAVRIDIRDVQFHLWDSGWFELDKNSIVKDILKDL